MLTFLANRPSQSYFSSRQRSVSEFLHRFAFQCLQKQIVAYSSKRFSWKEHPNHQGLFRGLDYGNRQTEVHRLNQITRPYLLNLVSSFQYENIPGKPKEGSPFLDITTATCVEVFEKSIDCVLGQGEILPAYQRLIHQLFRIGSPSCSLRKLY
jgi:hypothetical protein